MHLPLKIEELEDYSLKNVFASNGDYRLWCSFSPFYNTAIYKLEDLKSHSIVCRFADLKEAIVAFNSGGKTNV